MSERGTGVLAHCIDLNRAAKCMCEDAHATAQRFANIMFRIPIQ